MATGVSRTELFQLRQEHDEPFRTFAARVRGKAEMCAFTAKCMCTKIVNNTDNMIRDVLCHEMMHYSHFGYLCCTLEGLNLVNCVLCNTVCKRGLGLLNGVLTI